MPLSIYLNLVLFVFLLVGLGVSWFVCSFANLFLLLIDVNVRL